MTTFKDYIQGIDCIALALFFGPVVTAVICGILLMTKSKSGLSSVSSNSRKSEKTTLDLAVPSHSNQRNSSSAGGKHRKSRSGNKQTDLKNNKAVSSFVIKNWLQSDCYEGRQITSCFEDNIISYQLRNDTSSVANGNENLNSCSSNEDLSLTYLEKANQSNKEKLRPKRKQKRKQEPKSFKNTNIQAMYVEEIKENIHSSATEKMSSTNVLNLRKQCTKAAALKVALNNCQLSRPFNQVNSNLESNLSDRSSLSSSSSIASISSSISSSASNSPTQSVNSSPTASPKSNKRNTEYVKKRSVNIPLRQCIKLNMNEQELFQQMRRYIIDPDLLRIYGFPVESVHYEGYVEIYKCLPKHLAEEAVTQDNQRHHRHFYGLQKYNDSTTNYDSLYSSSHNQNWYASSQVDSGHSSGESSSRFTDSDSSEMSELCEEDSFAPVMAFYTPDGVYQIFSDYCNSIEKQCVRCSKMFQIDENGEYLTFDSCTYHWGKMSNVYDGKCYINVYSCCQGIEFSEGCCRHPLHVWNGVVVGLNGPYTGFLHTQQKETNNQNHSKIYAMDCEMSYTGLGLEVTKVTVVSFNGSLVYEHFVYPQARIIDYNTRFSGVSEYDFFPHSNNSIKTFAEVQTDLLNLFDSDTILIGHGLDNDLKVLGLVHKNIVDTSVIFSHSTGYPYRRSLKNLTKSFLKRDIQCGDMGHNSFEDSRACLELMMWKIRKDLRHWN